MLRVSSRILGRNYRLSIKYPSLVSYNKLPWEIMNHETPALHMHLAPQYEQLLTLAATSSVPHLVAMQHPVVSETERLRVLPGLVYIIGAAQGSRTTSLPPGFTEHTVADPIALQYYGTLSNFIAPVQRVSVLASDDLRLLCLAITFEGALVNTRSESSLKEVSTAAGGKASSAFTLYHYFRPNRPVSEITRPLQKYYIHRPKLSMLGNFVAGKWEPRLQAPVRAKTEKAAPMPKYNPPQSYLMGLAERMAVVPGNSFGRRSLMWGHWF